MVWFRNHTFRSSQGGESLPLGSGFPAARRIRLEAGGSFAHPFSGEIPATPPSGAHLGPGPPGRGASSEPGTATACPAGIPRPSRKAPSAALRAGFPNPLPRFAVQRAGSPPTFPPGSGTGFASGAPAPKKQLPSPPGGTPSGGFGLSTKPLRRPKAFPKGPVPAPLPPTGGHSPGLPHT